MPSIKVKWLFVAGFPRYYENRDLEKKFGRYGKLKEVLLKKNFAFIEFNDVSSAQDAFHELDGMRVGDDKLVIKPATPKESDWNSRLFVTNYPKKYDSEDIERIFAKYGKVKDVQIIRGFAFVQFEDYNDAEYARDKVNGREYGGEKLVVKSADPRQGEKNEQDSRRGDNKFDRRGGRRDFDRRRRSYSRSNSRSRDKKRDRRDKDRRPRRKSSRRSSTESRRGNKKDRRGSTESRRDNRKDKRRQRSSSSGSQKRGERIEEEGSRKNRSGSSRSNNKKSWSGSRRSGSSKSEKPRKIAESRDSSQKRSKGSERSRSRSRDRSQSGDKNGKKSNQSRRSGSARSKQENAD